MTEYELLRQEILAWQERRFVVLTGSITLVVVIMSFVLSDRDNTWSREKIATFLFMILGCASLFTWYAGWSNTITGAFLEVFHERHSTDFAWQTARRLLREKDTVFALLNVNVFLALIYLTVGLGCGALIQLHCRPSDDVRAQAIAGVSFIFFAISLAAALFYSTPFGSYEDKWREIAMKLRPAPTDAPSLRQSP